MTSMDVNCYFLCFIDIFQWMMGECITEWTNKHVKRSLFHILWPWIRGNLLILIKVTGCYSKDLKKVTKSYAKIDTQCAQWKDWRPERDAVCFYEPVTSSEMSFFLPLGSMIVKAQLRIYCSLSKGWTIPLCMDNIPMFSGVPENNILMFQQDE